MVDDGVEVEAQGQARFDGGVKSFLHVGRKPVGHECALRTFGDEVRETAIEEVNRIIGEVREEGLYDQWYEEYTEYARSLGIQ